MDRQSVRQIRGAKDLIQETIGATVIAIAETHRDIASVPYAVLEQVGVSAAPVRAIERVQQVIMDESYLAVLGMNELIGAVVTVALDRWEERMPSESSAFSNSREGLPMNPELNREYPEPGEA